MIYNEYDKLKTVMIGQAFSSEIMFDLYGESDHSKYHGKINDETNEDLDVLEKYLTSIGVKVYRPNIKKVYDFQKKYGNANFVGPGSCRDWMLAYGNHVYIYNTSWSYRNLEYLYWEHLWEDLDKKGIKIYFPENDFEDAHKYNQFENTVKTLRKQFDKDFKDNRNELIEEIRQIISRSDIMNIFKHTISINNWNDSFNRSRLKMIYVYEKLNDYSLLHSASFWRINDTIVGNPGPSTTKGFNDFCTKIKKDYDVNVITNTGTLGHIDGSLSIVNKKQYVCQEEFQPLKEIGMECIQSDIPVATADHESGPLEQWNLFSEVDIDPDLYHSKTRKMEFIKFYLENLRGYDQRVDFDFNFLTLEPNKILCGIFDKKKVEELNSKGIETMNLPLRHRWVVDGGIHCYTNDIERYD